MSLCCVSMKVIPWLESPGPWFFFLCSGCPSSTSQNPLLHWEVSCLPYSSCFRVMLFSWSVCVLCLDCVKLPSLWFTFFHEFGKFSATTFANVLFFLFFPALLELWFMPVSYSHSVSCFILSIFYLSLQTKVSPGLCISSHEFSYI